MKVFDIDKLEAILKNLNAAIKGRKLYPHGHPVIVQSLEKGFSFLKELLEAQEPLILGRVEDVLVFGHHSFMDYTYKEVMEYLGMKGIESVVFKEGLTIEEFSNFVELVFNENSLDVEGIQKELMRKGTFHITLMVLPVGERFLEVYLKAIETVKETMKEIRLGLIPKTGPVTEIVHDMTELVLEDRNAMIGLTMIKDYDNYLFTHSVNVSILALAMGASMGFDMFHLHQIGLAALLHDLGKTGVGEKIIKKAGKLSDDEFEKIREHPLLGYKIVGKMEDVGEVPPRLILEHHIGYNRKGYPKITNWDELHTFSMILTVADTYDALTTLRVYQVPYEPAEAIKIMKSLSGKHLDPKYLEAFIKMLGTYPVGTLVRLSTNEVGVVIKSNPKDNTIPAVKILFDNKGKKLETPYDLDLSGSLPQESETPLITSSVDPLSKNLDVAEYFKGESKL